MKNEEHCSNDDDQYLWQYMIMMPKKGKLLYRQIFGRARDEEGGAVVSQVYLAMMVSFITIIIGSEFIYIFNTVV